MPIGHAICRGDAPPAILRPPFPESSAGRAVRRLASPPLKPVSWRGFSLAEILVAVIVLTVGLLGMAGLQLSALKANDSARSRTVAIHASYDLIDRIRADPAAVLGKSGLQATIPGITCAGTPTIRWQKDFCAFGLPPPLNADSTNALEVDCANTSTTTGCGAGNCEIVVRWDDSRGDPRDQTPHNIVFSVCTRIPRA